MLRIYLSVISTQLTPDEICEVLSFAPDRIVHQGEVISGTKITSKANRVEVFHQVVEEHGYVHFADNLRLFVEHLMLHRDELLQLAEKCRLWLNCVDHTADGFPALGFENDLLEMMAGLKLNLDIDLYH